MNDERDTSGGAEPFNWNIQPDAHADDPAQTPEPIFGSSGSFVPAEPPAVSEPEPLQPEPTFATAAIPTAATLSESGAAPRIPAGEAGFAGLGTTKPEQRKNTKLLWWIAGGLIALVVVVALFFFGSQLPKWMAGGSPNPTPSVSPTAALSPGTYAWDQLYGGECINPFSTAWQETFTVVDCSTEHAAQLVYRGSFDTAAATAFPGEDALGQQINALCTRNGIFDAAAASAFSNLQVQGAYPVTAEQWDAGQRSYYCFVSRSDGSALTGSLQGAGPAGS